MLSSDETITKAMLARITLNLPTHVSATIPKIGKVMMAITGKATFMLVVK